MFKFLKRLFCKHHFLFDRTEDEVMDFIVFTNMRVSKCCTCGKEKWEITDDTEIEV